MNFQMFGHFKAMGYINYYLYSMKSQSKESGLSSFEKIAGVYCKKYDLTQSAFLQFLTERVDCSAYDIDQIRVKIQQIQDNQFSFDKTKLLFFLHIIAAVQAKVKIDSIPDENLKEIVKPYESIHLKKKNKEKQKKNDPENEKQPEEKTMPQEKAMQKEKQKVKEDQPIQSKSKQQQKIQLQLNVINQDFAEDRNSNYASIQKCQDSLKQGNQENKLFSSELKFNQKQESPHIRCIPKERLIMKIQPKKVIISGYEKFGHQYINSVIKFKICFNDEYVVYRRYSEFEKLMRYLGRKYEGYILPELPPKEGIKRNFSYLWGVDEAFLNQRQVKLEQLLNCLVSSKFISGDDVIHKFMTDENYEIECIDDQSSLGYLKSLTEIAFNAKQLKDYGLAYYNYISEYNKTQIKTPVSDKYGEIKTLLATLLSINEYRMKINDNFDKRRQVLKEAGLQCRNYVISDFDQIMNKTASEIKNVNTEYSKYLQLKSQQSWLNYLIKQKHGEGGSGVQEIKKNEETIKERVKKMEIKLVEALQDFKEEKQLILREVGAKMIEWRRKIHP